MIIITQPTVTDAQIDHIVARIEEFGLRAQVMRGEVSRRHRRDRSGRIDPGKTARRHSRSRVGRAGDETLQARRARERFLPPPVSIGGVKSAADSGSF